MRVEFKTIGSSGQISLGKENAGKTVTVDQVEPGVWLIKTAKVIPESELWLHTPEMEAKLDRAIAWMATHQPRETNFEEFEKRLMTRYSRRKK